MALLYDRRRVKAFRRAIELTVRPGDVVADLGAGLGILSLFAAEDAKKVYAVEWSPEVAEAGAAVARANTSNIEYVVADARTVTLPEPVDVVV